ncbi:beta-1,3-galactosyltransferase 5-like isoform X1 [Oculina patagonica]
MMRKVVNFCLLCFSQMARVRNGLRLMIRFFKRCLPLMAACLVLLLVLSVWRMLNDINGKVTLLTEQNKNFHQLISNYASRESITQLHIRRTKLQSTAFCPPDSVFLLILVSTNVGNFDRRQLIRKTWGADFSISTRWKTVFLLGKNSNDKEMEDASKESQIYGDIVQADYQEHFWNMSYKVVMGFEWSVKFCTFDYLLKADDDVFVNTLGLMDFLTKYTTPRRKFYTGNIMVGSVVMRDGRYGVSREEFNGTTYKPYCSGGGYVLSRDVVEMVLSHFDVLKPLKIDDAYIGILADRAGIKVTHNKEFRMYENNCNYNGTTLVQHPATGDCLIKLYNKMVEGIWGRLG